MFTPSSGLERQSPGTAVKDSRALMVLGTGSYVGKSIITAGLGRILADEGHRVAPFKAQNMSLNSAATPCGREIGRAQALQAEACRVSACPEMNPVLLKPCSDSTSQVMLLGRLWKQMTAAEYHNCCVAELFPIVLDSYRKLASLYEIILVEGAGSPAEVNLRDQDIVNMRMAQAAKASCLLVGDIDRGGVFASLLGTLELLEPAERALIRGFVINKFRGDESLLLPGIIMAERRMGLPCAGVIPYLHHLGLEEEDGVAVEDRRTVQRMWRSQVDLTSPDRSLRIGVIALPHISNFTDFDVLAAEPSVSLAYVDQAGDISAADLLILPGSKQTLDDLAWLRKNGFVSRISEHHAGKKGIIGICGGFQMLGTRVEDPYGVENDGCPLECAGLGLLPIQTILAREKTTRRIQGKLCAESFCAQPLPSITFHGYEIHVGHTHLSAPAGPLARIVGEGDVAKSFDGAMSADGFVCGTYVHGFFDDDSFRHQFIDLMRLSAGLSPAGQKVFVTGEREARLNRLASHLKCHLNMELIRSWIGLEAKK